MARKSSPYTKMSDQTNYSSTSGQPTFLSNRDWTYIDIVSLLAREKTLQKFSSVMATTRLSNILETIAFALEKVLDFKPQLEVMMSLDRKVVFREDYHYLAESEKGNFILYNPFKGDVPEGDVICYQQPNLRYNRDHLKAMIAQDGFDYTHIPNPQLFHLVADALTEMLNEDQLWVRRHRKPRVHFLQKYISLEKTVHVMAPQLTKELDDLDRDLDIAKRSFVRDATAKAAYLDTAWASIVTNLDMSAANAIDAYERFYAQKNENLLAQEFWELRPMQLALRELTVALGRAILNIFPVARTIGDHSLAPANGYDVYQAEVVGDREIIVRKLGDYRILHWELQQAAEQDNQ